jgi:hypothetical protein
MTWDLATFQKLPESETVLRALGQRIRVRALPQQDFQHRRASAPLMHTVDVPLCTVNGNNFVLGIAAKCCNGPSWADREDPWIG